MRHDLVVLLLCALAPAAAAARTLTLDEALRLARERNGSLPALEAEVAGARARLAGARPLLRDNPELEAGAGPRWVGGDTGAEWSVALSQEVEMFGQRGARVEAARAAIAVAEARLDARRAELAAEVREGFARWLAAEQRLRIAGEGLELAKQALAAAEARQSTGAASRLEVNAARAALGHARREHAAASQRRAAAAGAVFVTAGLDPAEPTAIEGALSIDETEPPSLQAAFGRAVAHRADLRGARADLDAARAERRLAAREARPRPRLGVVYEQESGGGESARVAQATLGIDLPLFDGKRGERGAAAARVAQAERAVEALTRTVRAEVALAASRVAAALAAARAFAGGDLAAAEENVQLVNEAYRAGKVDFFQLLVIRREALEARVAYVDALEELQVARAQLERAMGSVE